MNIPSIIGSMGSTGNTDAQALSAFMGGFTPQLGLTCDRIFDISKYVPFWVQYEQLEQQTSDPTNAFSVFDFLQLYYDWLYCDGASGAGYLLSQNLLDLIDVEKTNHDLLKRYLYTYLSGVPETELEIEGGFIESKNLIALMKNIRSNLYHQKSTIAGIRYFFRTLFGVLDSEIEIYEPKLDMLRLNGGRFYNNRFKFGGGSTGSYTDLDNLAGSYLNGSRMQDGDWIHDYSYLLKVGMTADLYTDTYMKVMHPSGIKVVFEKTMQDYVGPGADDGSSTGLLCEVPTLKNYAPYRLDTNYQQLGTGANNVPLYGITFCTGCNNTEFAGFTGPTHYHPSWLGGILSDTKFKDIEIFDFFSLCYGAGSTSPNDVLSCTGFETGCDLS